MSIVFKDGKKVLDDLKSIGYSTYKLRQEKIFGESDLTKIRNGKPLSYEKMAMLCKWLKCQIGDLLVFVDD